MAEIRNLRLQSGSEDILQKIRRRRGEHEISDNGKNQKNIYGV